MKVAVIFALFVALGQAAPLLGLDIRGLAVRADDADDGIIYSHDDPSGDYAVEKRADDADGIIYSHDDPSGDYAVEKRRASKH